MGLLEDKVNEPQFAGLPDWEVARVLNAPDETLPMVFQNILKEELISILMVGDKWLEIKENAKADINVPTNRLCAQTFDALTVGGATLFLKNQKVLDSFTAILTNLLATSLIDQAIYNEVLSKVMRYQSWAELHNLEVTARTVGIARGGQA